MKTFIRRPSLVQQVAEHLRGGVLRKAPPGSRLAPVRELAAAMGVSVLTVRAAQQALLREGLLEIRHGSGVTVAARPPRRRVVGIYTNLDVFQPRTSTFHLQVPRDLRLWFQNRGVAAEIYVGEAEVDENRALRPDSRFAEDVASGRLAGVVLLSVPDTDAWAKWVAQLALPAVGAETPYSANTDAEAMAREGVRRLRDQGCRRIGLLSFETNHHLAPFRQALAEAGLPFHSEWVRGNLNPMLAGAGWEEFREIWFASPEKPDGLLVADDLLFDEAAEAIRELGIAVPGRLRIVSHTNASVSRRYPFEMTLFEFDPMGYASLLGELLLARLDGKPIADPRPVLPFQVRQVSAGDRRGRQQAPEAGIGDQLSVTGDQWLVPREEVSTV